MIPYEDLREKGSLVDSPRVSGEGILRKHRRGEDRENLPGFAKPVEGGEIHLGHESLHQSSGWSSLPSPRPVTIFNVNPGSRSRVWSRVPFSGLA